MSQDSDEDLEEWDKRMREQRRVTINPSGITSNLQDTINSIWTRLSELVPGAKETAVQEDNSQTPDTQALTIILGHGSYPVKDKHEIEKSKFARLLSDHFYLHSMAPFGTSNSFDVCASRPGSRINTERAFLKALDDIKRGNNNLPDCTKGSFIQFADKVAKKTTEIIGSEMVEYTASQTKKTIQKIGLKQEEIVASNRWEQQIVNQRYTTSGRNSKKLNNIYDSSLRQYQLDKVNPDLTPKLAFDKLNLSIFECSDDYYDGYFVHCLSYCRESPESPLLSQPKILICNNICNLLEFEHWENTKKIWNLPSPTKEGIYSPREDPDIIELMKTVGNMIVSWNNSNDKTPYFKIIVIDRCIRQSNSVMLYALTFVLKDFIIKILTKGNGRYNSIFPSSGENITDFITSIGNQLSVYSYLTACRDVKLPCTDEIQFLEEIKSIIKIIKSVQPTPSQDILEQKKEKQLSILETVAENLETELEESTTCSNVSSSSMDECFFPKDLKLDFTREEMAKSDWQLSQLATTGYLAPEGGGGGVSDEERLEQERLAAQERERLAAQERERLAAQERERLAAQERERLEQERLERERLERERLEQERLEQERLERERLEQERLEQERLERERIQRARIQRERLAAQERERLAAEMRKDIALWQTQKTPRDEEYNENKNKKVNYSEIGGSKTRRKKTKTKKTRRKKSKTKKTRRKKTKSKKTRKR
jgi:hypothetical protein